MGCTPGDTHLLRQEVKNAKAEQRAAQQRNITGRQVFMMVHRFFAMNIKGKDMTDTARPHNISTTGDIQQFICKWGELISLMARRPAGDDLMNLFVLQFDVHLLKFMDSMWGLILVQSTRDRSITIVWRALGACTRLRETQEGNNEPTGSTHKPPSKHYQRRTPRYCRQRSES